jgi:putative hydrolase of the HAD superfamily
MNSNKKIAGFCDFLSHSQYLLCQTRDITQGKIPENTKSPLITYSKKFLTRGDKPYDGIITAKNAFYGFFQADAVCFDDTVEILDKLTASGIHAGFLTDVAYGMDNEYALADIAPIRAYFDIGFTSVDVGFRKPNTAGYKMLLDTFNLTSSQMLYIGDEEKDIAGANSIGITSVLINRSSEERYWGQKHTIRNLCELEGLL